MVQDLSSTIFDGYKWIEISPICGHTKLGYPRGRILEPLKEAVLRNLAHRPGLSPNQSHFWCLILGRFSVQKYHNQKQSILEEYIYIYTSITQGFGDIFVPRPTVVCDQGSIWNCHLRRNLLILILESFGLKSRGTRNPLNCPLVENMTSVVHGPAVAVTPGTHTYVEMQWCASSPSSRALASRSYRRWVWKTEHLLEIANFSNQVVVDQCPMIGMWLFHSILWLLRVG